MRLIVVLLLCSFAASCGGAPVHPWWREMTPEEKERERQYEQEQHERIGRENAQSAERRKRAFSVVQAFSLQDVKGCSRLGLIRYVTLDGARFKAAELDGDRILAQHNHSYPRIERHVTYDDYEIYRCDNTPPEK
jgi:hypothetical protein